MPALARMREVWGGGKGAKSKDRNKLGFTLIFVHISQVFALRTQEEDGARMPRTAISAHERNYLRAHERNYLRAQERDRGGREQVTGRSKRKRKSGAQHRRRHPVKIKTRSTTTFQHVFYFLCSSFFIKFCSYYTAEGWNSG